MKNTLTSIQDITKNPFIFTWHPLPSLSSYTPRNLCYSHHKALSPRIHLCSIRDIYLFAGYRRRSQPIRRPVRLQQPAERIPRTMAIRRRDRHPRIRSSPGARAASKTWTRYSRGRSPDPTALDLLSSILLFLRLSLCGTWISIRSLGSFFLAPSVSLAQGVISGPLVSHALWFVITAMYLFVSVVFFFFITMVLLFVSIGCVQYNLDTAMHV